MTLPHLNPIGSYPLVFGIIAVLVALLLVGPGRTRTTPRRRWVLVGVRVIVILLVLLAMLRPERVVTESQREPATLVILVDRSRSMQVADMLAGKTRWQSVRHWLDVAAPELDKLEEDIQLRVYTFDTKLERTESVAGGVNLAEQATGEQTAIGTAIDNALRRLAGQRLVGMLLLSDGAQRAYAPHDQPPEEAARRLADLGYPLYTFTFGQARGQNQARDVAVVEMPDSPTVYVKNTLDVQAGVRVSGYANQSIAVQLLFESPSGEMISVAATTIQASEDRQLLPVELQHIPTTPGEYKMTLRAETQDGELVTTNNELSTYVTVLKGGLNVLYVSGNPRWERGDIVAALSASPDVQVDTSLFFNATRINGQIDFDDKLDPGKFDVIILGDLHSKFYTKEDLQQLADRVDAGTGLIMLGGFNTFGPGGFQATPLVDVLPVRMGRFEGQNFGDPPSEDLHIAGQLNGQPLRMVPSASGHPMLALAAPNENRKLWQKLPPLGGANRFLSLKPGAQVLAVSEPGKLPLLVAGGWGKGRVLAFAVDTTGNWLAGDDERDYAAEHRRFWRQLTLWLARKDLAQDGQVWVRLQQRRFEPGSRVHFEAGALTPEGYPVEDANFTAEVILPDGSRQRVSLRRTGDQMEGSFRGTTAAGDYAVEVTATGPQGLLGTTRARFLVFEHDLELDLPAADPALMKRLAETTEGGRALAAEELPTLLRELAENPPDLEVLREVRTTYWDRWWLLIAFVAAISTEWYLRKRWGLV